MILPANLSFFFYTISVKDIGLYNSDDLVAGKLFTYSYTDASEEHIGAQVCPSISNSYLS